MPATWGRLHYQWTPRGLNAYTIINPVFTYDKTTEYLIAIKPATGCATIDTLLVK